MTVPDDPQLSANNGQVDGAAKARRLGGIISSRLNLSGTFALERTDTMITIGKLKFRAKTDDLPQYAHLNLPTEQMGVLT
jgi:hypothetical protein